MSRRSLSVVCVISLLFAAFPAVSQDQKSIAVLPLQGNGITPTEATVLTEELRSDLVHTGMYTVLERTNMESILDEQGFQLSGCTSAECAVEAGKLLGVHKMVAGSVGKIGTMFNITLRIFDVETGKIENTVSRRHEGSIEQLLDAVSDAGRELVDTKTARVEGISSKPGIERMTPLEQPARGTFASRSSFSIRGGTTSTTTTLRSDSRSGFSAGAAYHWHVYNGFFVQPELSFTTRAFRYDELETMNFESLQPALLVSYRFAPVAGFPGILMFSAGPAFNFILDATKDVTDDSTGETYTYDLKNYDGNDQIRSSETTIVLMPGIGYALGAAMISLEFRYEIALVNLFRNEYDWGVGKTRVVSFMAAVSF